MGTCMATSCARAPFDAALALHVQRVVTLLRCALQGSGGTGEGFEVVKYGDGRVALIGADATTGFRAC